MYEARITWERRRTPSGKAVEKGCASLHFDLSVDQACLLLEAFDYADAKKPGRAHTWPTPQPDGTFLKTTVQLTGPNLQGLMLRVDWFSS